MDDAYKQAKEDFVSGMKGSSISHVNLISLVALVAVALYAAIRTRISPTRNFGYYVQWGLLVLPMLLAMTVAANRPVYLIAILLIPTVGILQLPRAEIGTPLPSNVPLSPSSSKSSRHPSAEKISPLPALTTYRAHMMLMTVLAILAVDFPVFPRSLAKCETFGVSLMDLGVGSFIFSQGIVSAIPLVRDPSYITAPFLPKLLRVTKKSFPVIVLGLIRVLLVKGTEYPEHVTEYGVHWNFFITLALLPIIQVFLHPFLSRIPISLAGIIVALGQQIALSKFHLREYVTSDDRSTLISANKEGIVSLSGYLAIQLLGLSIGTIVLPPTPSFYSRRQAAYSKNVLGKRRNSESSKARPFDISAPRQTAKTATELCAYAILSWALLGVVRMLKVDGWGKDEGGVSRRMVNLPYILWVAAFNATFLLSYLVVLDLWIFAGSDGETPNRTSKPGKEHVVMEASSPPGLSGYGGRGAGGIVGGGQDLAVSFNPPQLLEVINRGSLAVFLFANVLTGLINMTVSTMYTSDTRAMLILVVYSLVVCYVPWRLGSSRWLR
ncbi:hypothetical protein M413DRAFT_427632 [Hebeloma cylindrosporum]|uniref:GPI-anchored wall transfer protein n=1 Tax=Hebeloma cylindrosporum TaxID=76867 RepID=A0A0C3BVZ3_HEBCY|nr:hypothetical protein M413DRAFT_427632 [Hebeloma cylindrosporum h7]